MADTRERAHRAWTNAERVKRLSDRVIGVGPIGLGLDGVLAWIPGANLLYTVGAGGLLIYDAVQSGASGRTLVRMGLFLAADSALSGVPVAGWAIDTFFPGHRMAAGVLQKDIEKRHGRPAEAAARGWGGLNPFAGRQRMRNVTPGA